MSLYGKVAHLHTENTGRFPEGAVVATNGVFDILHVGHVTYLEQARALGDYLVVGVNSDESATLLKGKGRPLNPELNRALVLASLESVSRVVIFPQVRAVEFLRWVKPHIWVKAGDYTIDTINAEEREVLEQLGCKIKFMPLVNGVSTTSILKRLHVLNQHGEVVDASRG